METFQGTSKVIAWYKDGRWVDPQPSVLSFLTDETDELDGRWPRAGTTRGGMALQRGSHLPTFDAGPWSTLWPTPTTQDAKNDGAPSQQDRNSKPLNALIVLHPEGGEGRHDASKTPLLNTVFVEFLMGFPEGWTRVG